MLIENTKTRATKRVRGDSEISHVTKLRYLGYFSDDKRT
jgi:hypothetical protein